LLHTVCILVLFTSHSSSAFFTLSLHDALPIFMVSASHNPYHDNGIKLFNHEGCKMNPEVENAIEDYIDGKCTVPLAKDDAIGSRSEEHTSELQSRFDLVCRLLLETKNYLKLIT